MSERWVPIAGYGGQYEVSDLGRVRSRKRTPEPRTLRVMVNRRGYAYLFLYLDGFSKLRYVHHLVMRAFVGPRPDGLVIRHLDGDSTNNALQNMRYGTTAENNADMVRHGRHHLASRTHCNHGHEFTPENIWQRRAPNGRSYRTCKKCAYVREAATRERRSELRRARYAAQKASAA